MGVSYGNSTVECCSGYFHAWWWCTVHTNRQYYNDTLQYCYTTTPVQYHPYNTRTHALTHILTHIPSRRLTPVSPFKGKNLERYTLHPHQVPVVPNMGSGSTSSHHLNSPNPQGGGREKAKKKGRVRGVVYVGPRVATVMCNQFGTSVGFGAICS